MATASKLLAGDGGQCRDLLCLASLVPPFLDLRAKINGGNARGHHQHE